MRPCRSYRGGKGLLDRLGKCLFTKRLCDMLSAARSVFWVNTAEGSIGLRAEEAALIRPGHQSVFPLADTLQTPWANTGLPLALCLSLRQPQVKSTLELTLSFFSVSYDFALSRSCLCSHLLFPAFLPPSLAHSACAAFYYPPFSIFITLISISLLSP